MNKDIPYTFENLFVISLMIQNKGNKDLDEFVFTITVENDEQIINVEQERVDKHHNVKHVNDKEVSPKNPSNDSDLILKPFNRNDIYNIRFYVTIPGKNKNPGEPKFSSSEPVNFTRLLTFSEKANNVSTMAFETLVSKQDGYLNVGNILDLFKRK